MFVRLYYKQANDDELCSAGERVEESCMNSLEEVNILKTVRSGSVDFNKLTTKGKRRKLSL